ncbi:MAG: HesA/MoeB/ThiF family protein [Polyangiaceae bacterium]
MSAARERARVLVVGAGGLAAPSVLVLAHAGVGTIGLVDDDEVETSNLHRQILFRESDVGRPKIEALSEAITRENASIRVETHPTRFLPSNALDLASMYDVIIEGSDNFPTKFLTADACRLAAKPVVHASALRWIGTVLAVGPAGRPCYRCLFEDIPQGDAPSCATAGVIGPVVGVVGALQAELALRIVDLSKSQEDGAPFGELVTFDGKTEALRRRRVAPRSSCMLCGDENKRQIREVTMARYVEEG